MMDHGSLYILSNFLSELFPTHLYSNPLDKIRLDYRGMHTYVLKRDRVNYGISIKGSKNLLIYSNRQSVIKSLMNVVSTSVLLNERRGFLWEISDQVTLRWVKGIGIHT